MESELMKTDGTATGTSVVKDFTPGAVGTEIFDLTRVGNQIYFVNGNDLWRTDGTDVGTLKVFTISSQDFPYKGLTAVGNTLYFTSGTADLGRELWKTDGTTAGTVMVKDVYPGTGKSSAPDLLTAVGNWVYFRANDSVNGSSLWKSDGTANGTVRVTGPMVENIYFDGQSRVYCSAYGLDASGWELYKYDVPAPELPVRPLAGWRLMHFGNSENTGEGANGGTRSRWAFQSYGVCHRSRSKSLDHDCGRR